MNLDLSTEQRHDVIYAFLKAGVPHTAVARALSLDVEYVRGAQSLMRTEKYGTDDASAAFSDLIWVALEEAYNQILYGTAASKARFIQLVLARSIGLAGKATPEASEKIRAALAEMAADISPVVQLQDSIYTPTE